MAEIDYTSVTLAGAAYDPYDHISDTSFYTVFANIEGHPDYSNLQLYYDSSANDGTFTNDFTIGNFSTFNADGGRLSAKVKANELRTNVSTDYVEIESSDNKLKIKEKNPPKLDGVIYIDEANSSSTNNALPSFTFAATDNNSESSFTTWDGVTRLGYSGIKSLSATIYKVEDGGNVEATISAKYGVYHKTTGNINSYLISASSDIINSFNATTTDKAYTETASGLADGSYIISILAEDNDGNTSTFTKEFTVTAVKPTVSLWKENGEIGLINDFTNVTNYTAVATADREGGSSKFNYLVRVNGNYIKFNDLDIATENTSYEPTVDGVIEACIIERDSSTPFKFKVNLKDNWTNVIVVEVYDEYGNKSETYARANINCSTKAITISDVKFIPASTNEVSSTSQNSTCKISCKITLG